MLAVFGEFFQSILFGIAGFTGSYGLAIIVLTVAIRGLLVPLSLRQTRSMAAMRKLQPKMKEIQEKYKDQPQEQQKRLLQLYKEHKVNPLSGCLPLLVQIPFLYAIFLAINTFPEGSAISPEFLFWDLSKPDGSYALPLLSGLTTYLQTSMMATDTAQRGIQMIMPVVIFFVSIGFPAGLVLYWVVSNLFGIGQQAFVNSKVLADGGDRA